ncbi:MAG: hypothetical protein Q4P18_01420 [Methanobrevibacter sp.]|uniref:hypothetical protein n=1 Tax=Methanobrevibacter sp. TaxID=66852 RepID=UPI0026E07DCE|nr:hypothetical protein [Methanobrevibacter sp.]MDO5848175.1 hypothetical protein [Methanobrevibacter sp.]
MIEDNIQALRRLARISSGDDDLDDHMWCIIAGNVELVDEIAYKAIASNRTVKILFREHVIINENKLSKKFDFIMLYGKSFKIDEFKKFCDEKGGAFIRISHSHLKQESNLMAFIAPENVIKDTVAYLGKSKIPLDILSESQTTAFIDVDVSANVKLPNFIKKALKPIYSAEDVVLSTVLVSAKNDSDVFKVQSVATSNKIFVIDFKDFKNLNMEATK